MKAIIWGAPRTGRSAGFLATVFIFSISLGLLPSLSRSIMAAPLQTVAGRVASEQEIEQMRSIAEAQFEIVKIQIKQGHFEQVLPEMREIYKLNLPEKYEQALAESASLAANLLQERKQFDLAHQILDEAFGRMRRNENRVAILKVNAFVYKSEGNLDKAMELFNRAIDLERQSVRP